MNSKPLQGIRVVDFTRVLAGPYTTMMLADLGAEVIKIEQPDKGEDSREFGPFKNEESGYYIFLNRGKRGITLNLKDSRAHEVLRKLVAISDVVVENFKPGVMRRFGLDYEQLRKINPRVVMCSISGFGQEGSLSNRPAYDLVVQAMSGMMSINGFPNHSPCRTGNSLGDMSSALYAGMAIMTALYHRERTGQGQYIDISMLDSVFAFLESNVVRYSIGGVVPQRVGSRHPLSSPFDIYKVKDGYVVIAVANDRQFASLCHLMEKDELASDVRFCNNDIRSENDLLLKELLEQWLSAYTVQEVIPMLIQASIPSSPVLDIQEACDSSYMKERGMMIEIHHPVAGKVRIPGDPLVFSGLDTKPQAPSPLLGEHNEEVLKELLGYSDETIQAFSDSKVI